MTGKAAGGSLYVGLMSGTSADGIDAVLCRFEPETRLLAQHSSAWPEPLRADLLALGQGDAAADLDQLGHLDTRLGQAFAEAVRKLLQGAGVQPHEVAAIGSHGQTLRHRPHGAHPFTWQIGNPWVIAEQCGIPVVADFRRADLAAGGQAAPLMPIFHHALLARPGHTMGVLNLGGIGNLTVLGADGDVLGFDTGPANALLDAWCLRHSGQPYDRDGRLAARGKPDGDLLSDLMSEPYFALPPPKSTGREVFQLDWLSRHLENRSLSVADVQASLLALTVQSITEAVQRFAPKIEALLVCGGGVHNRALMAGLQGALSPRPVQSTATRGVDPDCMEAMGFAWLARQRLLGLSGNLPSVTGAHGPRLLGTVHPAPPLNARD